MTDEKDPPAFDDPPFENGDEEASMGYYDGGDAPPAATEVERVLREHDASLLALPGVVGVQTGQTETGDDCILVLVRAASDAARIPRRIGGVPVRVDVSGEIDAQG